MQKIISKRSSKDRNLQNKQLEESICGLITVIAEKQKSQSSLYKVDSDGGPHKLINWMIRGHDLIYPLMMNHINPGTWETDLESEFWTVQMKNSTQFVETTNWVRWPPSDAKKIHVDNS